MHNQPYACGVSTASPSKSNSYKVWRTLMPSQRVFCEMGHASHSSVRARSFFKMPILGVLMLIFATAAAIIVAPSHVLASPVQQQHSTDSPIEQTNSPTGQSAFSTDTQEILVGFQNSSDVRAASASAIASVMAIVGEEVVDSVAPLDTRGISSVSCNDSSVPGIRMMVHTADVTATVSKLAQHPDVLFALPNVPVYAANHPAVSDWSIHSDESQAVNEGSSLQSAPSDFEIDDPLFENQRWYMDLINGKDAIAEAAAAQISASNDSKPVIVAVIDSGIDLDHPEFAGRLLPGHNFIAPESPPIDDFGHGTHVAGLIGAAVNNTIGIAGLSPKVKILPYKTLNQSGAGRLTDVVQAICRAVDDGADIINLSLTSPKQDTDDYQAAFDYADQNDVLMIAAAGNRAGIRNMWPARLPTVMGIAAIGPDGTLASYNSPADSIDMAAPGGESFQQLLSTWPTDVGCTGLTPFSDDEGGSYCDSGGTSMAAALVSGVAATLIEFHPDISAEAIRTVLVQTATAMPNEDAADVGSGLLDAQQAVSAGLAESQLMVSQDFDTRVVPLNSPPFIVDIEVSNPGFSTLTWGVSDPTHSWVKLSQAGDTTRFNITNTLSIEVDPTGLPPRLYFTSVSIFATTEDGTPLDENVDIDILFRVDSEPSPEGQLIISPELDTSYFASDRGQPIATAISVKNVGAGDVVWVAELDEEADQDAGWIELSASTTGTVSYLETTSIPLQLIPQNARLGKNQANVILRGTRADGSTTEAVVEVVLDTVPSTFFPLYLVPSP